MFEQTMKTGRSHAIPLNDESLTQQVYDALKRIEPLRVLGVPIGVQVHDGMVTLNGIVPTYPIKAQVFDSVRSVPGVKHVRNELLTDSDLEIRVAYALSTDVRTHQAAFGIIVNAVNGLVTLVGHVPTFGIAQTAETITASVPGVRGVSNDLQVA
jgi:osmotically-inducible protein OsmY